jgi:hypothetical protein
MRLDLKTVADIATDVAREQDENLEVVGVSPAEGEGSYTEIMIVIKGCQVEPCTISLGVLRDVPTGELRSHIADRLRTHLAMVH